MIVLLAGTWVWTVASRLGHITGQSALGVLKDAVTRGGDSQVAHAVSDGQRITLALYGYGGDGHDGAYLSDSIMVVVIQPRADGHAQIAELSLPRDWFVPIDLGNGHKYSGRINEPYADAMQNIYPNRADQYKGPLGGGRLADDTLQRLLGIHIDHFVGIDFHAFQYVVDAVGGVDIDVQHSFTDHQYPHGECDQGDCAVETVHFDAGMQHMDGARALIFSRSRHSLDNGEGTDFARSRRQQLVLNAVRAKVVSISGIGKLPDVLSALGDHVITDLQFGDMMALYNLVKDVNTNSIEHISIDNTNFLYDCGYPASCPAYYLYARDPSFAALQRFVNGIIPDQSALAEKATIRVVDASGMGQGGSTRWAALLTAMGFHAVDGGTSPTTQPGTQVVQPGTADPQTARWLGTFFAGTVGQGATVAASSGTPVPGTTPAAAPPVVTVVLGRSEEVPFAPGGTRGTYSSGVSGSSTGGTAPRRTAAPTARPAATPPPQTPAPTPAPTPTPLLPPGHPPHP